MAAAPSSMGTQIRQELSCSICLELFTRPKMLPCQHTFCQDCLQDHASRRAPFQCPNCRQQVRLPSPGVAGLPDNRIVANLCERFQQQATLPQETSEQPQSGNKCSFHPSEEVRLYCKECKVPICNECFEEGHDGHPTKGLRKAAEERRSAVHDLVTEGRNKLEKYCSFIRGLREEDRDLDQQKRQTDEKIMEAYRQACEQTLQKLTEEKDRLLSEVETNHRETKGAVQSQRDALLTDVTELSAACDGAEQDMARDDREFLSRESKVDEVVGKFRDKTQPNPLQTHPAVFQPKVSVELVCTLGDVTVPGAGPSSDATTKTICNQFGRCGSEPGQFNWPLGLTEGEGEIFVADLENLRIQVFTLQGTSVRQFPTVVSSGEKMYPDDVAMDGEGNLWVVGRVVMSVK
ncbi:tripartite motif-containing protein 2-like [Branchiostoma floridae x Branchiostoma belcheri]